MSRLLYISLVNLYLVLFVGLVFHTSSHPWVLGKYTFGYFVILIILVIMFWPYVQLVRYTLKTSVYKIGKKKYFVYPFTKFCVYFFILFALLIALEVALRYKNIRFGIPSDQDNYAFYTMENFHPFLQHQNVKADNAKFKDLHINSYGFRGNEIKKGKGQSTFRIFLLGGSTVFNKQVAYDDSVGKKLEELLSAHYHEWKIEVLNAGADGYTSQHSIIQYEFFIKNFSPDLLIMWHGINDLSASCTPNFMQQGPYRDDYAHWYGPLKRMVVEYYQPKRIVNLISMEYLGHFLLSSLYSDFTQRFVNQQTNPITREDKAIDMKFQSIDSYERNLQTLINLTKQNNTQLILGNQPYLYSKDVKKDISWYYIPQQCNINNTYPNLESLINGIESFNKITQKKATENNIPFVDLDSKIPKNTNNYTDDVHFLEQGNKLVADVLFERIVSSGLIQ